MPSVKGLENEVSAKQQEITRWKFKYNSKNAEYILLWNKFEEYKQQRNLGVWLVLILSAITLYLNYD